MKTASRTGKAAATGIFAVALVAMSDAASGAAAQGSHNDLSQQTASVASTDSMAAKCKNKGRNYIVRNYYRGVGRYTLRCGTSTWGWKHIQHRWSAKFDNKIRKTIAIGRRTYVPNGFSFYTLPPCSREAFRVLIGTPAAGNDIRTAYKVKASSAPHC